eukprot:TRINITY_DN65047_c0_g1_i1.p1 TRINITY_DN65047_c0_g1~~TRINITY_DN65047_c0_g1_i1.p1  ORF type:complete len:327 (+),score=98.32 TRINITY_DN65047_c0_g1_i1:62-982(+)
MAKHRRDRARAARALRAGLPVPPPPEPAKGPRLPPAKKGRKNRSLVSKAVLRKPSRLSKGARAVARARSLRNPIEGKLSPEDALSERRKRKAQRRAERRAAAQVAASAPGDRPAPAADATTRRTWELLDAGDPRGAAVLVLDYRGVQPQAVQCVPGAEGLQLTSPRGVIDAPYPAGVAAAPDATRAEWRKGELRVAVGVPRRAVKRPRKPAHGAAAPGADAPAAAAAAAPPRKRKRFVTDRDQAVAIANEVLAAPGGSGGVDKVAERDLWQERQKVKAARRRQERLQRHYDAKHQKRAGLAAGAHP